MIKKILQERSREQEENFELFFQSKNDPTRGYSFVCDSRGNVDMDLMSPCARENYFRCFKGEEDVEKGEIRSWMNTWVEPRIGLCECGDRIVLDGFTNTCTCGRDYNSAGQELAPRSQWGCETGESLSDILHIQ